jgi:hypothetical protein
LICITPFSHRVLEHEKPTKFTTFNGSEKLPVFDMQQLADLHHCSAGQPFTILERDGDGPRSQKTAVILIFERPARKRA